MSDIDPQVQSAIVNTGGVLIAGIVTMNLSVSTSRSVKAISPEARRLPPFRG